MANEHLAELADERGKRYKELFEGSRDALITIRPPDWHFVTANRAALELFEAQSLDQLTSMPPWLISPETQPDGSPSVTAARHMISTAMAKGSHSFEWQHRTLSGREFSADVLLARLDTSEGSQIQATVRDITRRKELEATLAKSNERWKFALEGAGEGVWDWNPQTDEAFYSDRWQEMIGYLNHDFPKTGAAWRENLHPEDRERVLATIHDYFFGEQKTYSVEFRIRCKDGSWRWIEARGMVVRRDSEGNPHRMLGTHADITMRKEAEAELRIAATAFQTQEGILITDANTRILKVNESLTRITGYSPDECIGQTPRIFSSGRQDEGFYKEMWKTINTEGHWEGEIWNRRKSGESFPERLSITSVKDANGRIVNYVANFMDITMSRAAAEEIKDLAFFDTLTHLPNRRLFLDRLHLAMTASLRSGMKGALLLLDLDNFKTINDTLGHDMGDSLLQQVAERIAFTLREEDTVARLGGDEFIVLVADLGGDSLEAAEKTKEIGNKLLTAMNHPYQLGSNLQQNTPSIGVTIFSGSETPEELMKQSDIAMYHAKRAGRNTVRFFDRQMQDAVNTHAELERDLRIALEQRQFELYYQIQVDQYGHAIGAEALIRWNHPDKGLILPGQFIPVAEESDLILGIGEWVLEASCSQLAKWGRDAATAGLVLSVNVSSGQIQHPDFIEKLKGSITRHGIPIGNLKLEITEGMLLKDGESTIEVMKELNDIGLHLALDDFGTGYSSLSYLKRLPIDQIKIDQSFVRDMTTDPADLALVRTIISMAYNLQMGLIAEGVETEDQLKLLANSGCTIFQGYLFGKPVPNMQFEALIRHH